jgi:DNA-binding transcriptional regulator YbjK
MNIDYQNLENDLLDGSFRQRLEEELTFGFRQIHQSGERLPLASHYASQIAEIVNRDVELSAEMKYELYQEVLSAVENARAAVLGEVVAPN